MNEPKILGWAAVDIRDLGRLTTGGGNYSSNAKTAKLYASEGAAKAAMSNSYYKKAYKEGFIKFFPVTIPEDL